MTQTAAFKTPEGEAKYLAAYDAAMKLWPVPYEETEIPGRFGMTHVVISGPEDAPPMMFPTRFTVNAYFGWLGFKDNSGGMDFRPVCDLIYLGIKHFSMPPETSRIMPTVRFMMTN